MKKKSRITTLWDVVNAMQSVLERHGLDDDTVDAAVVVGVESMLAPHTERLRRHFERRAEPRALLPWRAITAKA